MSAKGERRAGTHAILHNINIDVTPPDEDGALIIDPMPRFFDELASESGFGGRERTGDIGLCLPIGRIRATDTLPI